MIRRMTKACLCTKALKRGAKAKTRVLLSSRVKRKHISRLPASFLSSSSTPPTNSDASLYTFVPSEAVTARFSIKCYYPSILSILLSPQPLHPHQLLPINTPRCTCGNAVCISSHSSQDVCSQSFRWTQGARPVRQDHSSGVPAMLWPRPRPHRRCCHYPEGHLWRVPGRHNNRAG
jgi:hypothetical protein